MVKVGDLMLIEEIKRLKEEKDALILAHFYQVGEIQDLADHVGDSLYLSKMARDTDKKVIVFCGVHFMAETAKILAPQKKVLLPRIDAGCPMASMASAQKLETYLKKNPETTVVSYVNTTAEIKALSDVCVTSSNAEKVIQNFRGQRLLYVPDQNMGAYLKEKFDLNMDLWPGFCYVHNRFTLDDINQIMKKNPNAEFIAHPEMKPEILKKAAFIGSTSGLLNYVKSSKNNEFIIGTEVGVIHQMKKVRPDANFITINEDFFCRNMKKTTLEDLHKSLKDEINEIEVDRDIMDKARLALERMFELTE